MSLSGMLGSLLGETMMFILKDPGKPVSSEYHITFTPNVYRGDA